MLRTFCREWNLRKCVMSDSKKNRLPDPAELFRQYGPLIWKIVSAYLDNPDDIQECVNDTFCELYLHSERYDPEKGSYAAFLSAAARNKAIDKYRKNLILSSGFPSVSANPGFRRTPGAVSGTAEKRLALEEFPAPDDMAEKIAQRLDLEEAIASLKPKDAELIRMKYFDGMTIREISASLELPYETVKKRHQRALHKLRRQQDC